VHHLAVTGRTTFYAMAWLESSKGDMFSVVVESHYFLNASLGLQNMAD